MRNLVIIPLLIVTISACSNNKPDIYHTKKGKYASKEAGFVADFPKKPYVSVKLNRINGIQFKQHIFRAVSQNENIYKVIYAQ